MEYHRMGGGNGNDGGKKLRRNRVWSANIRGLMCREYKFSLYYWSANVQSFFLRICRSKNLCVI